MSNFRVPNQKYTQPYTSHKATDFLPEVNSFFKKYEANNAMYTIVCVVKDLKMKEKAFFDITSQCNSIYFLLQVFQSPLIYPCFMIRNPYKFDKSPLIPLSYQPSALEEASGSQ